jgi:predicted site-specific integrase-resolvase
MKYYSIHEFSKLIGRTPQTIRNWDASGRLKPNHTGSGGYRYYSHDQLREVLQIREDVKNKVIIGYCRVSSNKQKDDLQRQIDNMKLYLETLNKTYEIISDIGSGINYSKKGLRELIKKVTTGQAEKIVVLYKDRLLRFGFELVEYIANLHSCEIEVIDNTEKTEEQELVEDLIQIVTVFSCKLQGKRANKARKMIQELVEESEVIKSDTGKES